MLVADIMTAYPEALGPDASVQKAAQLMRDHDFGVIPVVDELGQLVGIVTDRDIVIQAVAKGHGPETPLNECMTPHPDAIGKDMPIDRALHLMNTRQIRRVPVVENGRLIGMVSLGDVAKSQTPDAETMKTLESVSSAGGPMQHTPGPDEL